MKEIKVLLAEDHTIVRKGIRSLIDGETGIIVVGEAEDGREAIEKVEKLQPHVVVMDIAMPGLNGIEATHQLKRRFPEINVLILSMYASEEYIFQTLRAGASGYLLKKSVPKDLIAAIKATSKGEPFLSPTISQTIVNDYIRKAETAKQHDDPYQQLTQREREVLQLLAEGVPNRIIAKHLFVSVKTIETHRAHIMTKLNINNTADLTRYAIRKGLINL